MTATTKGYSMRTVTITSENPNKASFAGMGAS